MIVGSATPTIKRGWPPKIECMIPQIAVEASVSTVLKLPSIYKQTTTCSISLSSFSLTKKYLTSYNPSMNEVCLRCKHLLYTHIC